MITVADDHLPKAHDKVGPSGNDVREKDDGNTVSDTDLIDLFRQPHNKRRTCAIASNDNDFLEHADFFAKVTVRIQKSHITVAGYKGKSDRHISCDCADLLTTLFTLLGKSLKRGDRDGKKLDHDGCCDIGVDRKSEQSRLRQSATRNKVHILKDTGKLVSYRLKNISTDIGNGNVSAQAIQEDDKQCEEQLLAKLHDLPSIF